MNTPELPPDHKEPIIWKLLHYLPQTIVVMVGFAYVTGFLTIFTFLERFGVREAGSDFFKIKYVHVGILALFFPFGIVAPIVLILSLRRESLAKSKPKASDEAVAERSIHLSNAILLINMMFAFYVLVLFAEPTFFQRHELLLPSVFTLTLVGVALVNIFVKKRWMHHSSKWILVVSAVLLQLSWWRGMSRHLAMIFWGAPSVLANKQEIWIIRHWPPVRICRDWVASHSPTVWGWIQTILKHPPKGGIYYVLFTCLCFLLARRTQTWATRQDSVEGKIKIYAMGLVMIGTTYFLSVLTFAYRVYPYIPVAKGGGDYTNASPVAVQLRPDELWAFPEALFADPKVRSVPASLILIEQTPETLFAARVDDAGGPAQWRAMERLPDVIEISREDVQTVIHSKKGAPNLPVSPTPAPPLYH